MSTKYERNDMPFEVNQDNINDLFEEAMDYLYMDVLPLYQDMVHTSPREGLDQAVSDFLSNESSIWDREEKRFLTWEEALELRYLKEGKYE